MHLHGGGAEEATSLTAAVAHRVFARSAIPQQVALSFSRVSVLQLHLMFESLTNVGLTLSLVSCSNVPYQGPKAVA